MNPSRAVEPSPLRLPDLEAGAAFGGGLARRSVSLALGGLATLAAVAVVAAFTVSLDIGVAATGVLEPHRIWPVRPPVDGVVSEITVTTGDTVDAGQAVLHLDVTDLAAELEMLHLQAELAWSRPDTPRAERELLAQQVERTEEALRRRIVTAPGSGVVLTEEIDELLGVWIQAGSEIFEIGALDAWHAELDVDEKDVHLVQPGDQVSLRIRAVARAGAGFDRRLQGRVSFVGADPIRGPSVVGPSRYRVVAELDPQSVDSGMETKLRRGMSVEARVTTRTARAVDVLWRRLDTRLGLR